MLEWRWAVHAALIGLLVPYSSPFGGGAQAEDFYRDKQLRILVGTDAGGDHDFSARLVARHLFRHIPGTPQILVQNMPGAASMTAANYLYNAAPQDGTVIAALVSTIPHGQIFGDKNVKFDVTKFQWIGSPSSSVDLIVAWRDSAVTSLADAKRQPVLLGATTRSSAGGTETALANELLGTRFKLITGYKGGNEIDLAMERGEVRGRAGQSWSGWKATRPDWVRDGKLTVLVQIGLKHAADLPQVPLMSDLAPDLERRQILDLYSGAVALGRPLLVGPDVPPERVALLRAAFRAMINDPQFREDAGKVGVSIEPVTGEELQAIVARMVATPRDIVAKAEAAMTYKELEP
jgi:tripartite-type tricarboxylate transporter receptor subunit TctC